MELFVSKSIRRGETLIAHTRTYAVASPTAPFAPLHSCAPPEDSHTPTPTPSLPLRFGAVPCIACEEGSGARCPSHATSLRVEEGVAQPSREGHSLLGCTHRPRAEWEGAPLRLQGAHCRFACRPAWVCVQMGARRKGEGGVRSQEGGGAQLATPTPLST